MATRLRAVRDVSPSSRSWVRATTPCCLAARCAIPASRWRWAGCAPYFAAIRPTPSMAPMIQGQLRHLHTAAWREAREISTEARPRASACSCARASVGQANARVGCARGRSQRSGSAEPRGDALLIDQYELTMAASYLRRGHERAGDLRAVRAAAPSPPRRGCWPPGSGRRCGWSASFASASASSTTCARSAVRGRLPRLPGRPSGSRATGRDARGNGVLRQRAAAPGHRRRGSRPSCSRPCC